MKNINLVLIKKLLIILLILSGMLLCLTTFPINGNNFLPLVSKIFKQETGLDFVSQKAIIHLGKDIVITFPHADINYNRSNKLAHIENTNIKLPIKQIIKKDYKISEVSINNLNANIKLTTDGKIEFLDYIQKSPIISNVKINKYSINMDNHKIIGKNLTLKDNKIIIKADLYINNSNQMFLKGIITDFENPNIDVCVKAKSILLNDVYQFAQMFYPTIQKYNINSITGSANADLTLKGNLKNLKSSGYLKIINASGKCANYNIQNITSDIDLSNNKIIFNNTHAIINNAPISIAGTIIGNKLNINVGVNNFNLKNLKHNNIKINNALINATAKITGTYKKPQPCINANISNIRGVIDKNSINIAKISCNAQSLTSADTILENIVIRNIKIPKINANLYKETVTVMPFDTISNNLNLQTQGKIYNVKSDKFTYKFKTKGYINYANQKYPTICFTSGNKKYADVSIQALQNKQNPKIGIAKPVIFNLNAKIKNSNSVNISDCGIYTYNNLFSENLKNNITNSKKLCDISGNDKAIKINIPKPITLNITHYMVTLQTNLNVTRNKKVSGHVKIPSINDKYGYISARKIYSDINNNNIMFNTEVVNILNNKLSCAGQILLTDKNFVVKNLNVKTLEIDSDSISAIPALAKHFNLQPVVEKGTFSTDKLSVKTHVNNYIITKLTSNFKIENQKLYITNILGNMYNGKVGGNLIIDMNNNNLSGTLQGRGLSSSAVAQASTKLKEKISGKLDFDMNLNGKLNDKFLKSADIKFIIKEGQMSILGKVEHLLYAQNIIADHMLRTSLAVVSRAISAKDTGLFNYMNGILSLNNETVTIKYIKMQGPNMSMYIRGKYNLTTNIAQANILGRLSNAMFSSLGTFGTLTLENFRIALTGEEYASSGLGSKDIENIPQLPQKSTKEFSASIYGMAEDKSAVKSFKWISISQKDYRVKEIPHSNAAIPKFIDNIQ